MKTKDGPKRFRWFWTLMFVFGLVLLGLGLAFHLMGFEMIMFTVLFGGAGIFFVLESFGRMMGWEK